MPLPLRTPHNSGATHTSIKTLTGLILGVLGGAQSALDYEVGYKEVIKKHIRPYIGAIRSFKNARAL